MRIFFKLVLVYSVVINISFTIIIKTHKFEICWWNIFKLHWFQIWNHTMSHLIDWTSYRRTKSSKIIFLFSFPECEHFRLNFAHPSSYLYPRLLVRAKFPISCDYAFSTALMNKWTRLLLCRHILCIFYEWNLNIISLKILTESAVSTHAYVLILTD